MSGLTGGAGLTYKAPPTVGRFMRDDAILKVIVGPLGSGKSMGCLVDLLIKAMLQAPDAAGIRPTRFVMIRNSAAQLRETVLADAKSYFPFARWKVSTSTLELRLPLPDGTRVESDWLFMPLERPEDTRKLLSLNLTGAFVEECREVRYEIIAALMGRIGRYPSKSRVAPTWQGILAASNPWPEGTPWHDHLVVDKPAAWSLYRQPGGMSPEAENVDNLPDGYYSRLMEGHSENWINVHVHAQWGEDESGQAVFRASFDPDWHIERGELRVNPERPLLLGIDFGRTGAAIIGQESVDGRLICFEELKADDRGLDGFMRDVLMPRLRETYWNCRIFGVGDPAGGFRSQLSDETAFSVMKRHGLDVVPAPTNDPGERIRAVEKRLLDSAGRAPALIISAEGCPSLVRAMQHGYRYRRKRDGELVDLPEKNDASHVADALQYLCLGARSNYVGRRIATAVGRGMATNLGRGKRFSSRAWT